MSESLPTKDELKRKILFVPCNSKESLHRWIKVFLGLDMPDCIVDKQSTSTPMDIIWEVYERALKNDDPDFSRVMAYAARDSFKCCSKGTKLIDKNNGIVNIEDVKIGDEIWSGKAWRKVTDWIHDGIKEGVSLTLSNGANVKVSPIHKVWAWKPGQLPAWHIVSELTTEDMVLYDLDSLNFEQKNKINQEEYDIGYLCGILTGDGCLTLMDKHRMVILSNIDEYVIDFWKKTCLKYAGKLPKQGPGKRKSDWAINSKTFTQILKNWGLTTDYSWGKKIPEVCWRSHSYLVGFISGVLDTDGSVEKVKKHVIFSMTAERLLKDMQVALASLGVNSKFRSNAKIYGIQKHLVHHLIVSQNDLVKLLQIGVRLSASKANIIKEIPTQGNFATDTIDQKQLKILLESVPRKGPGRWKKRVGHCKPKIGYSGVHFKKILDLLDWAQNHKHLDDETIEFWRKLANQKWLPVKNVEVKKEVDFYDLTVEEDHSYWSNGIVSHNTLSAAIIEVLMLCHLDRSMVHLAAIEQQAAKCSSYVKKFLMRPFLRDYIVGDNKRETFVVRYENKNTGENITQREWQQLSPVEQISYNEHETYIKIIVATLQSTNSDHVNYCTIDEVDVITNKKAYEEAKLIPASLNGKLPITLLTSTRKSYGLVQKEIDEANVTGLQIRHWNIMDVTESCPASRHRPDLPKVPIWSSDKTLKAISQEEYENLPLEQQETYVKNEGYSGCLTNCKLFAMCKGRLATEQKSRSPLLKPIADTINKFKSVNLETARAQLLCYKPSTEGLVYPNLDKDIHLLSPDEIAFKITGEEYPESFTKAQLLQLFQSRDISYYAGLDFGYSHCFAGVLFAVDGNRAFVIDAFEIPQLEQAQQIEVCEKRWKDFGPVIYPDTAYPGVIKAFSKAGFKMRNWNKGKGSVMEGIDIVRTKIMPTLGEPTLFFLKGDEGVEQGFKRLSEYHWKLDGAGKATNIPDDEADDLADASRYGIMNVFKKAGKVTVAPEVDQPKPTILTPHNKIYDPSNWFQQVVTETTQNSEETVEAPTGKKGKFVWDVG